MHTRHYQGPDVFPCAFDSRAACTCHVSPWTIDQGVYEDIGTHHTPHTLHSPHTLHPTRLTYTHPTPHMPYTCHTPHPTHNPPTHPIHTPHTPHNTQAQVRQLAEEADLANKHRKDSQGICFLGKVKFGEFIKQHLGEQPGDIVRHEDGEVLGQHRGVWYHTIGQRKGIPLSGGPW